MLSVARYNTDSDNESTYITYGDGGPDPVFEEAEDSEADTVDCWFNQGEVVDPLWSPVPPTAPEDGASTITDVSDATEVDSLYAYEASLHSNEDEYTYSDEGWRSPEYEYEEPEVVPPVSVSVLVRRPQPESYTLSSSLVYSFTDMGYDNSPVFNPHRQIQIQRIRNMQWAYERQLETVEFVEDHLDSTYRIANLITDGVSPAPDVNEPHPEYGPYYERLRNMQVNNKNVLKELERTYVRAVTVKNRGINACFRFDQMKSQLRVCFAMSVVLHNTDLISQIVSYIV